MKKEYTAWGISFADAEYKFFEMSKDGCLTVYMQSWDEKILRVIFSNVIRFSYMLGDVVQGLYEIENYPLEKELMKIYNCIPNNHVFKFFQIEDIYDVPFIEVIAESVVVTKE